MILFAEAGLSPADAAVAAGVSPRSLRRWRAEGQRELDALSPEARLALAFTRVRASRAARKEWRESARFLDQLWAERVDPFAGVSTPPSTVGRPR